VSRVVAGPVLAIHPGALGDVLLSIPALRALRDTGERLILAAQPHIAALLVALGEADEARAFESLRLDALMAGGDDVRLPVAEQIVCWFGAREPLFVRRLAALAPLVRVAPSTSPARQVWEHLLATLGERRGPARRGVTPVGDAIAAQGLGVLAHAGVDGAAQVVVVHPGAGGRAKRWPAGAFADVVAPLAAWRDLAVVIHEGPADADAVAQLRRLLPSARVLRQPALPTLAGVLARCAAYLGNDSGVSHLAAAVGAPAVVLFARSNLAWRPWAEAPRVLTVTMERVVESEVNEVRRALGVVLG